MSMNVLFWFYTYGLTLIALGFAIRGIKWVQAGDLHRHRRAMTIACNLILFFVLTYLFKVIFLGREDKSDWSLTYKIILYIHESFIFGMLVAGGYARYLAHVFRHSLDSDQPTSTDLVKRKLHGRLGKACILFAIMALGTASVILYGMVVRQS